MSKPITPTMIEMVENALKAGGYDGLFNVDGECACEIGDLFPCDRPDAHCRAGYKQTCSDSCGEHDWHIAARKGESDDRD